MIEVDVLIVGGGASGLTSSALLSTYGLSSHLVSYYPETSRLPKAHALSIKTMEIFRELGVEREIRTRGTPPEHLAYIGYYAGVAGPHADYGREIFRLATMGRGGKDVDWLSASASAPANLTQNVLEPLLKRRAEALAPQSVLFNQKFISYVENVEGVIGTIEDRETGERYQVRAKYLLACDGGKTIGPMIGVEMEGHLAVATNISFHFAADLSPHLIGDEILIRTILNPDAGVPRVIVPVGPTKWGTKSEEWVFHLLSAPGQHLEYDDETAVAEMRKVLGLPELDAEIFAISRWPLDAVVASHFRKGRAFVLGDAAHRMPPAGGHGLNTAVQDCYNLCWKIAAVVRGGAGEALLNSYESERRPVAQRTVASALENWQNSRKLGAAIGFSPALSPDENWRALRLLWAEGDDGDAARRAVREALSIIMGTYNAVGLSYGYSYEEGALIVDDVPAPKSVEDTIVYVPTTRPGHTVPHAWFDDLKGRTALDDLIGNGRFTLIAGEQGDEWCEAARIVSRRWHIPLTAFTAGATTGDRSDLRFDWTTKREFGPRGAVLVRPDRFVAWRSMDASADPQAVLEDVFVQLFRQTRSQVQEPNCLERKAVP